MSRVHVMCREVLSGAETYRVQSESQLIVTSSHKIHGTRKWLWLRMAKDGRR